jgi:hypothetical protein
MNSIFDISSGNDHMVSVGFTHQTPYLTNRLMTDELLISPLGTANGFITLRVINPLMSQSALAGTKVFVFARAASDMDFQMPRDTVLYQNDADELQDFVLSTQTVLQAGALGDDLMVSEVVSVLVPSPAPYPGLELLWGEKISSIRALLQKPSKLQVLNSDGGSVAFPPFTFTPGVVGADYGSDPLWTYAGYYRAPFLGIASSEVFKIFPKEECWIGMFKSTKHLGGATCAQQGLTGTLAPMTFCGPNKGGEFRLPYYSNKKYYPGNGNQAFAAAGLNSSFLVAETSAGAGVRFIPYYSLGPDIRATCFRQVPKVILDEDPFVVTRWW